MRGHLRRFRRPALGSVVATVLLTAAMAVPSAGALTARPDLVPELPGWSDSPTNGVVPSYVDLVQQPGSVLYRFTTNIRNRSGAGTLDIYSPAKTGLPDPVSGTKRRPVFQIVWSSGKPNFAEGSMPQYSEPAGGPRTRYNRTRAANAFFVWAGDNHDHWHLAYAATYALVLPSGKLRTTPKVGFCLLDNTPSGGFFSASLEGWCHPPTDDWGEMNMGISSGYADRYQATQQLQWIDVTGLRPGGYPLRFTVNPRGYILETTRTNNRLTRTRPIPGTIARGLATQILKNDPTDLTLSGKAVAPGVFARTVVGCSPTKDPASWSCLVTDSAGTPLDFTVKSGPAHGTLTPLADGGVQTTTTYAPATGYVGRDRFTFTVKDERGLESRAAAVTLTVTPITIAASRRTISRGGHSTLSGKRWTKSSGESVTIWGRRAGTTAWVRVRSTTTGANGAWSATVSPRATTFYQARHGTEKSPVLRIRVRS
jgi:hypothetical protein